MPPPPRGPRAGREGEGRGASLAEAEARPRSLAPAGAPRGRRRARSGRYRRRRSRPPLLAPHAGDAPAPPPPAAVSPPAPPSSMSPEAPRNIPPTVLDQHRIRYDKVEPDDATRAEIANAKVTRVVGAFKLCVDATGTVTTVDKLKSTASKRMIERSKTSCCGGGTGPWRSTASQARSAPCRRSSTATSPRKASRRLRPPDEDRASPSQLIEPAAPTRSVCRVPDQIEPAVPSTLRSSLARRADRR